MLLTVLILMILLFHVLSLFQLFKATDLMYYFNNELDALMSKPFLNNASRLAS